MKKNLAFGTLLLILAASSLSFEVLAAEGTINESAVITRVTPLLPSVAQRMGVSGPVEVNITVDDSGTVTEAVAQSGPAMLRATAEAAILKWKFKPAAGKGKIIVNFK